MPDPIDPEALASALDSAIDNAIYWRDYCARDGENAEWKRDVATLAAAMPVLLAAPAMLKALRHIVASAPIRGLPLALELDIQSACDVIKRAERAPEPAEPTAGG